MKHFKLRKDLSIEINGRKLFRIEATENLSKHNVKKGDLGGYVEKESNLSGEAWVSGEAEVSGEARVSGNAFVYGDKIEKTNDLINITSNTCSYNITITPLHIKIGCQYHTKKAWFNFTDDEIRKMDGEKAVEWWKIWKPILKTICEGLKQ